MKLRRRQMSCMQRRRAAILIAALVCLAIVMALVGGMLLSALTAGRQLRAERDLRQCELLLTAGIARARSQVANIPDYRGEIWQLPGRQISADAGGAVTIEVDAASSVNQRQWHVIAEYPLGDDRSVRRSKTIPIPSPTALAQE